MSTAIPSDNTLLQKIAVGDAIAFSTLYYRYYPKIYQYCLHLLKSPSLAEEVVQEVMLKVWTLGYKVASVENLDAWLRRVTRNRAIDLLRKKQSDPMKSVLELEEHSVTGLNFTEEVVLLHDAKRLLSEAIDLLPEQQQRIYLLNEQDGHDAEYIAGLLGLKISTVYTHLKLARGKIKKYLVQYLDVVIVGIILKFF